MSPNGNNQLNTIESLLLGDSGAPVVSAAGSSSSAVSNRRSRASVEDDTDTLMSSSAMPLLQGVNMAGVGRLEDYFLDDTQVSQDNQESSLRDSNLSQVEDGKDVDVAGVTPDMSAHPSGLIPTLHNIVATVNLDCRLDLKHIALHARNAEYNPRRFAAVIMRIRDPKTTALIFASGKMVVAGARSEEFCRLAARKFARIIQKLGFPARFTDFRIQNIVGSCDVRFPVRLEGLAFAHGAFTSYEPELFPGLVYRMVKPKVVLLIFVSGRIVLTGARVREEIYQAFENIYPVLSEFRKP